MAKRRGNFFDFLWWRIGRLPFWIGVVVCLTLSVLAHKVIGLFGDIIFGVALLIVFSWRLHDFGRKGLIGFWVNTATNVVMNGSMFMAAAAKASASSRSGVRIMGLSVTELVFQLLAFLGLLVWLGFVIWLGTKRGDPGPNRFGVPLGYKAAKQADAFS